jgi:hypothetical protein
MAGIVPFQMDDSDPSAELVQQQQLMVQLLQLSGRTQAKLKVRQDEQAQEIVALQRETAHLHARLRQQETNSRLITVNQLDIMLGAGWTEPEKIRIGTQLRNFSRNHHVQPVKIPHPTLPNGVNGYEPGIVKAWLEEQSEFNVPRELQYVD